MLSIKYPVLREKMKQYKVEMANAVVEKDKSIQSKY
jgi:phosphoribosylcarboxyaminoimidazole (NCAIR) mutase